MTHIGMILLALSLIAFVEFAVVMVRGVRSDRSELLRQRLRRVAQRINDPRYGSPESSIIREETEGFSARLEEVVLRLPFSMARRIDVVLYRAGIGIGAWRFLALTLSLGAGATVVGIEVLYDWTLALPLALAVMWIPWLVVGWRRARRLRAFEEDLPEALDLICRALRAGHALLAGFRMVADELDDPVAAEFNVLSEELALGLDLENALGKFCHRIGLADLYLFSTAVLIQRETGGNLAEIMEKLGYVIRERFQFYGKVRSMTALNRGTAMILLMSPPTFGVLMYQVAPDFVSNLWRTENGMFIAMIVSVMTVVGYLVARRMGVVEA